MKPINIEPLSYIGIIIILITLVYSFLKNRREDKKKEVPLAQTTIEKNEDEMPALVAAIAMIMEGKTFRIKRIILSGKKEKGSSWRHFGRQEIMRRRMNIH